MDLKKYYFNFYSAGSGIHKVLKVKGYLKTVFMFPVCNVRKSVNESCKMNVPPADAYKNYINFVIKYNTAVMAYTNF